MKLAACAVDFNVGFFADQASGFEGISHFLEHMVFMGSEKYPGENHFSDWLSQHWGSENACTDSEQTTYYFECHPKHLAEGLDIFSGYFLSPLLKMDAVEREVTAVESEFERVVNNDATRVEAIMGARVAGSASVPRVRLGEQAEPHREPAVETRVDSRQASRALGKALPRGAHVPDVTGGAAVG